MTLADLEATAEEKYPTLERETILKARAEWERAAYIRGRLDQAEADAQRITALGSAEFANNVKATWADGESMKVGERIAAMFACTVAAAEIRKGVE